MIKSGNGIVTKVVAHLQWYEEVTEVVTVFDVDDVTAEKKMQFALLNVSKVTRLAVSTWTIIIYLKDDVLKQ